MLFGGLCLQKQSPLTKDKEKNDGYFEKAVPLFLQSHRSGQPDRVFAGVYRDRHRLRCGHRPAGQAAFDRLAVRAVGWSGGPVRHGRHHCGNSGVFQGTEVSGTVH